MESFEILDAELISNHSFEPKSYFQSDDNVEKIEIFNKIEKDNQLLSNSSSYVKQDEINIQGVRKQKPSSSDAEAVTSSKKRPFIATKTKLETTLPQRKLPLGAIPNYMKNLKGNSNTKNANKETIDHFGKAVCIKSITEVKLKNSFARSFQDSMTKINKINLNKETTHIMLVEDETSEPKNRLLSDDSVYIAIKNCLLESQKGGDQILFNDSDIQKLTDKINHIFEKKAILEKYSSSKNHSDMSMEYKIMLKKIYDQSKKIYQLQVAYNDLIKHKSEEIKILEKKLQLCKKKIMANKVQKCNIANEIFIKSDTNLTKEKATIEKTKIRFDCLMIIIEKLKIELNSKSSEIELVMYKLFETVQNQQSVDFSNTEQEKSYLNELDRVRKELDVMSKKHDCLKQNNKSSFDDHSISEIIKSSSERNKIEQVKTTLSHLSHKYTILKSKMEDEKHKNATQMNLLELRGEIIRNMQDNDDYHKMRITSLLKDIEFEKQKSTQFVKLKAAHQEELNNMFSTITETQRCNTQLEAELEKATIGK